MGGKTLPIRLDRFYLLSAKCKIRASVVVAQLVERSLPTPVISKLLKIEHLFTVNCIEKTKIKKKRPGMANF